MKKFTFLLVIIALSALGVKSQTLPYTDDFESYTVGGFMAAQNSTWWTTWDNLPGSNEDGDISDAFAHSGTKSVLCDDIVTPGSSASDLILKLGNKTTGKYELSWFMYVETGKCGYYNIQHFQSPGTEWAQEVYFRADGSGMLLAGSATAIPFTYPKDTWFQVKHIIDLDADDIKMYVNGILVHEWPFSYQAGSTTGTKQLGGVDFYAGAYTGTTEVPKYFLDDVTYQVAPTILLSENMDTYAVDSYLAVSNPTWFTTWSNTPGTAEDALIKSDFANSPANSAIITKTGSVSTDLILKLGNKVTGKYELSWMDYVGTGFCGYYNIQHFQSPGTEWALEAYFRTDGTGQLYAGGTTAIPFTYPKDTWFQVKHIIDLDADDIKLYVNNVLVHEWPFHYQADATTGTNQIGGVDFFAGEYTGTTEVPKLYLDDVYFAQLGAPTDPIIGIDPASLSETLIPGSSNSEPFTIANTGASALNYNLNIIYAPVSGAKSAVVTSAPLKHATPSHSECSAITTNGGSSRAPEATAILHYDGDNASAVGWASPPITVTVAARYPNALTLPYAGMMLESVDVYINDLNASGNLMTVKVFGMGTIYEPGVLLSSQTFTPAGAAWEHIVLSTPVLVTGEDLWVGYQFTQTDETIYIPGTDAGPNDPNGDYISTGVGWSHLSNNPALPYNWNIRANLNGTVLPHWLTVAPMSGSIPVAGNQVFSATFNAAQLTFGVYHSLIRVLNNDPAHNVVDVPCMLSISVGINELDKVAVMVYPNPAQDRLNLVSNDRILKVSVISFNGKTVLALTGNQKSIDISSLAPGVYFVQTQTAKGISNIKFTKN